ncbi:MAG: hypothetical protein K2X27_05135 [Candidatus Obscuribacterales bacterium]|nr:hypothetical protein [Candidatus Obscuribacterales bacterium]
MYCLIYRFKLNPGKDEKFRIGWRKLSLALIERCNSLGARLHLAEDNSYIAYAQWPSREVWQKGEEFIGDVLSYTHWDEDVISSIEVLFKMEACDDLLVK